MPDEIDASAGRRRRKASSGRDDGDARIHRVVMRTMGSKGGMKPRRMAERAEIQDDKYTDDRAVQSADGFVRRRDAQ